MFGIGSSVRIYYCPTPINLRKSFDGLAGAVEEYIKQDPESGHVFAFFSRNKKLVKLLQWEDGGFVIWMKQLEQGGFHIPQSAWQKMIDEGKFSNIKDLAATVGVDSGLISRTIRLTLLSPKIIHKLLSGELDLSWDSCRRSFPDSWAEQEKVLLKEI